MTDGWTRKIYGKFCPNLVNLKHGPRYTRRDKMRSQQFYWSVKKLNESELGCALWREKRADPYYDFADRRMVKNEYHRDHRTNIEGTSKDGKSIYIHFVLSSEKVRKSAKRSAFMRGMEARGALVGYAYDFGDCWDIIENVGKRKKRTYQHRESASGETKKSEAGDG